MHPLVLEKMHNVFRVTGLRTGQSDDALEATLKAVINHNLSEEERSNITFDSSIVPSCYDVEQKRVALVKFRDRIPNFLSKLKDDPSGDLAMEMDGTFINFDCHFLGFTQLYTPSPAELVTAE